MTKITVLIFAIILICISELSAQSQLTLFGGLNLSTIKTTDNYSDLEYDMLSNYNIGVSTEFPLIKNLSLVTGLNFIKKGYENYEEDYFLIDPGLEADFYNKLEFYYIDIPIVTKLSKELGKIDVFAKAGPYVGIGIKGNSEADIIGLDHSKEENDVKFGNSEDASYKRLESGIYAGIGITYKSFQLETSYKYGLTNIYKDSEYGKVFNRIINFTIGYNFKLKNNL